MRVVTSDPHIATTDSPAAHEQRLRHATVLVELGELSRAELEVADVLERCPEHLDALSLFAKLKHMRGELSLAVACGAQLQAKRAASGEMARMHLESMLHLAQDPERGAGEFLAVGQYQLVRKPTAYLALEDAFRSYVARRPNEARAACRQVGKRYREKDPEVYKLAVLAESWISELIGDLEAACETLELLGQERGFETDLDRLSALVSLYERVGTREKLEAAVNICRHLEKSLEHRAILGRLALLFRRLGRSDEAELYQRQHIAAYRRRMHRPSLADAVAVAAERFLPIERLREIRFGDSELPAEVSPRERAIACAIRGDGEVAGEQLAGSEAVLDLKYRANLKSLEDGLGALDQAVELYARALRGDPDDPEVIGWLLETHARDGQAAIAELFREPPIGSRAAQTLESMLQVTPNQPRVWRQLGTLFGLQPGGEDQRRQFEARAAALDQAARDRARAIGRVLSAAMYRFIGKAQGLIHEVWATREMASPGRGGMLRKEDILGNLTEEMKDNVRNIFLATREYAQAKFPHLTRDILDYTYSYKVTKEDEPSGGTSAGLPTALAFLSLFLQRPVPQDIALTGAIVTDAHDVLVLRPVGDIEYKVDAAYHRNLRMIVLPLGNQAQLEQSSLVPREISAEIVRHASNLDEAVKLAFGEGVFL